jgi:hypothetical protein
MQPSTPRSTRRSTRHSIWRRRLALLVAALAVGLGGVTLTPASPAQAATHVTYCFPIWKQVFNGWWIKQWHCFDIPLAYNPSLVPDYAVGIITEPELPVELQQSYVAATGTGLDLLGQASRATDPRTAAALRARAQDSFLAAARYLGAARAQLGQVGIAHVPDLRLEPMRLPWLVSAGVDLTDGLSYLQRALTEPAPNPWIERGMTEFQTAYDQLAAPPRG